MDIFFDVLLESFYQKLAFVVYFGGEERQSGCRLCLTSEKALIVLSPCPVTISYSVQARYHRKAHANLEYESLFWSRKSFFHSRPYSSSFRIVFYLAPSVRRLQDMSKIIHSNPLDQTARPPSLDLMSSSTPTLNSITSWL